MPLPVINRVMPLSVQTIQSVQKNKNVFIGNYLPDIDTSVLETANLISYSETIKSKNIVNVN